MMELKGKQITLGSKLLGIATVYAGLVLKATIAPELPFNDVISAAVFAVVVCAPVDASLIIGAIGSSINSASISPKQSEQDASRPCGFNGE